MLHNSKVNIAFFDVGQGDTTVISIPETKEAVIVDCVDAIAVFEYLEKQGIQHIRGLIVTHLHRDHCKEVVRFLENCEPNWICERLMFNWPLLNKKQLKHTKLLEDKDSHSEEWINNLPNPIEQLTFYQELKSWAERNMNTCKPLLHNPGYSPLQGSIAQTIEILSPSHSNLQQLLEQGLNNCSGVLKIHGPGSSALLTADIEPAGWKLLRNNLPENLHSDVLKFPHHGAWKDDDPDNLLSIVDPSIVIISVGTNGIKYKHPNINVFDSISKQKHIRLLSTQATEQCAVNVLSRRAQTVQLHKEQAATSAHFFVEQSGCPCAGTVIIELGDSVRVIQPDLDFHQDKIVLSHFNDHKCLLV